MATKSIETEATEVRAVAKYVRVSPSKARLVVDLIRRKPVAQAFDILHFCDRAVAVDVGRFSVPPLRTPRTTTVCVPTTWLSPLPMLTRVRRLSASVPAPRVPLLAF